MNSISEWAGRTPTPAVWKDRQRACISLGMGTEGRQAPLVIEIPKCYSQHNKTKMCVCESFGELPRRVGRRLVRKEERTCSSYKMSNILGVLSGT